MSGLIGIVGEMPPDTRHQLLKDMAQALKHEDWYQVDLHVGDGMALGRVSLGILNPEPQPIWNEDGTLCIVMEGEVYDYEEEKRRLIELGHHFQVDNDPEYVLHLYEEYGEGFALKLNGAFVAAIWDVQRKRLLIVNDRFGLVPLFYCHLRGHLLFGGGAGAILASPDYTPKTDAIAMAEFLTLEHVLGNRTLFEGIMLLPPASLLTCADEQLKCQSYWDLQFREEYGDHDENWYIERWIHYTRQAVWRRIRTKKPIGVLLSGGLDSRTVLAMIDRDCYPVNTFTFGIPQCDDIRLAREVAFEVGATPHFFELKSDFLIKFAEEGVKLTDGLNSCAHMHVLAPLREIAQRTQMLLTGSVGDTLNADHHVAYRSMPMSSDDNVLARALFKQAALCVPEAKHSQLFSETFYQKVQGAVFESFKAALAQCNAMLPANKAKHYWIRQSDRRWILEGQRLLRSQAVVRMPFYDHDLFDFMLNVPPGLRLDGYLYERAFSKAFPKLAKIPWAATGLPLVPCMRDVWIRAQNQLRWRLRESGLKWVSPPSKRPYADYDDWMRSVLRPWVEETLLSKRALGRDYFNPDYVRSLVAEHMAGANHARKLGVLLTLELWHQLFMD